MDINKVVRSHYPTPNIIEEYKQGFGNFIEKEEETNKSQEIINTDTNKNLSSKQSHSKLSWKSPKMGRNKHGISSASWIGSHKKNILKSNDSGIRCY